MIERGGTPGAAAYHGHSSMGAGWGRIGVGALGAIVVAFALLPRPAGPGIEVAQVAPAAPVARPAAGAAFPDPGQVLAVAFAPAGPETRFVRVLPGRAADLCAAMVAGRTPAQSYTGADAGGESCYWLAPLAAAGASLFFSAHAGDGSIGQLRAKLNATPERLFGDLGALADFVSALHRQLRWPADPGLDQAIRAGGYFAATLAGTSYSFRREDGAVPRYNLIITLGEPAGGLRADRFGTR
jgi:hypothetical protein